jgi:membrane-associated protein
MTLLGYNIGNIPVVRHNFEKVVIGIAVISVLPVVFQAMKSRKKAPAPIPG